MQKVDEIRESLSTMHSAMCQGFEKGDIKVTEAFQQYVTDKHPSDAELREHLKQLLQQELMTSWDAICDSLCKRIQSMVLEPRSTPSDTTSHGRQPPMAHASHNGTAKQSKQVSNIVTFFTTEKECIFTPYSPKSLNLLTLVQAFNVLLA